MVFFNHATRQMTAKIVYYGPGLCGKTTNLNAIYSKTSTKARGEMVSLNTETDRTLFFDLLPMDVGMVGGFKTKLQLYTVPGQVFYNSTRKLVLKGVDGIVFVVDSQVPMLDASKESLQNLEENLKELGLDIRSIPMVFQWNKRDLKNVVPVDQLERELNPAGMPSFQAVAQDGSGVFETLRGVTKLALGHIKTHVLGEGTPKAAPAAPPPAPAPPAPAPPPPSGALTFSDLPSVSQILGEDTGGSGITPPPGLGAPPRSPAAPPSHIDTRPVPLEAVKDALAQKGGQGAPEPPKTSRPEDQTQKLPALEPTAPKKEDPDATVALRAGVPQAPPPPPPPSAPAPSFTPGATAPMPLQIPKAPEPPKAAPAPIPPTPAVPPAVPVMPKLSVPAPVVPKPALKSPNPKDAINSLLGELTMVGRLGAPSVLRVDLPDSVEGQELEVVLQVRAKGAVVAETALKRPAPAKGIAAKLSVELKRG